MNAEGVEVLVTAILVMFAVNCRWELVIITTADVGVSANLRGTVASS